jgi:choline dehydrogenase-like flavoprotein
MCDRDAHLMAEFTAGGLRPFRLHCGIQYQEGCAECLGAYCPKRCKIDAANGLIAPALASGRLTICAMTEVTRLEADAGQVLAAHVQQEDDSARLTADRFLLAAGGYFSPALLLRSTGPDWPHGLANHNDQVGRNLMFHASEPMAVWPRKTLSNAGPTKTIAVRDFYAHDGKKYGELQSAGQTASYGNVLYSLRLLFDQSPFRRVPLVRQLLRIPAWIAAKVLGEATVFATIVEDYPYPENRIVLDDTPSGIRFDYTIHPELLARSRDFKTMLRRKIKHLRVMMLSHKATLNYGHPCGTCRAGDDPATSVVDADGKAHGVANLYVVDGAYMPTSGGTNPSLTIAANAMRIAERIIAQK